MLASWHAWIQCWAGARERVCLLGGRHGYGADLSGCAYQLACVDTVLGGCGAERMHLSGCAY